MLATQVIYFVRGEPEWKCNVLGSFGAGFPICPCVAIFHRKQFVSSLWPYRHMQFQSVCITQAVGTTSVYESLVSFAENEANCANRHTHTHTHTHTSTQFASVSQLTTSIIASARSRDSAHFTRRSRRRLKVIRTNLCSCCHLSRG